jgi:hypothetical protein
VQLRVSKGLFFSLDVVLRSRSLSSCLANILHDVLADLLLVSDSSIIVDFDKGKSSIGDAREFI